MVAFLNIITSFPTIVYSVLLAFVLAYWLLSLIGLLDIDILDLDLDIDGDVEFTGLTGSISGLLISCGLTGVPLTIVVSLLVIFSWIFTYFTDFFLLQLLEPNWIRSLLGLASIIASFLISVPITARLIQPLKPLFQTHDSRLGSIVGTTCIVTSSKVNEHFGRAEIKKDHDAIIIYIRSNEPNTIRKGDNVLIIDCDAEKNIYKVASID
ncbi:hypothetical protein [Zooshikella harenae]|uniref:DUF1449 family protein n=1 Tax=Zooshikella harenae TaxID=2827238 RepID=A0ABS5Z931_9GAMM|nr:hypothetical protein [Zooshikella harenae]MBU2710555.1 hypothetical protein [Zooshikella harenae]